MNNKTNTTPECEVLAMLDRVTSMTNIAEGLEVITEQTRLVVRRGESLTLEYPHHSYIVRIEVIENEWPEELVETSE